jgi:hypothetical protein
MTKNIPKGYKRVWGRLPDDRVNQIQGWADELGMSYSSFVSLAVWIGAQKLMEISKKGEALDDSDTVK